MSSHAYRNVHGSNELIDSPARKLLLQTNKPLKASLVVAGVLIALIAAMSGWALRGRSNSPDATQAAITDADATRAPFPSPPTAGRMAPTTTSRASSLLAMPSLARNAAAMVAANDAKVNRLVENGKRKLLERYRSEPVDAAWASHTQTILADTNNSPMLASADAKPLAFDSQCHSSVCLIGADFASRSAADDWLTLYTTLAAEHLSKAAVERTSNPDGTIHLQIYGQARN